jgi:membrane protein insertase Oxa1/YidC/SpoIIIJ
LAEQSTKLKVQNSNQAIASTIMSLISTLAIAMGSAWVSGINLYAGVATLGLLSRFTHLRLPGELDVLTSWWVIGIAIALYVVEFVADKVPWVDSTWDVIHTFIRVPAGAVLAASAFGDFDRSVQVIALLLGGGLALSSHGTKATTRAMLNMSPEPVSNSIASIVEDVLAIGSTIVSVFFPILLFIIVGVGVGVSIYLFNRILRFFKQTTQKVRNWFAHA